MEIPERLQTLSEIIDEDGWEEAIDDEWRRVLKGYPDLPPGERPALPPLVRAWHDAGQLRLEEGLYLSHTAQLKLVALLLNGMLMDKNRMEERLREDLTD